MEGLQSTQASKMDQASRFFDTSCNRWEKLGPFCGHLNAVISDLSSRLTQADRLNNDQKLARLEKMKSCAIEIAKVEAENEARQTAMKEVSHQLQNEFNGRSQIPDFMGLFNKGVAAATNAREAADPSNSESVRDVQRQIESLSGEAGEEDVAAIGSASQQVRRCPVTGTSLENPYKNRPCGHVVSLEGAIAWLYQKNGIRGQRPTSLHSVPDRLTAMCPTVGCNKHIRRSDLVRDFRADLTQRQAQLASSRRDSVADDHVELMDI